MKESAAAPLSNHGGLCSPFSPFPTDRIFLFLHSTWKLRREWRTWRTELYSLAANHKSSFPQRGPRVVPSSADNSARRRCIILPMCELDQRLFAPYSSTSIPIYSSAQTGRKTAWPSAPHQTAQPGGNCAWTFSAVPTTTTKEKHRDPLTPNSRDNRGD